MSALSNANPGLIRLRPSRVLLAVNLLMHSCIIVALSATAIPLWSRLAIMGLILIHGIYWFYRWLSTGTCQLIHQSNQWYLQKAQEPAERWQIMRCYYWSRWLVILEVTKVDVVGAKTQVIYWPVVFDSCEPQAFQRLRVTCRFLL